MDNNEEDTIIQHAVKSIARDPVDHPTFQAFSLPQEDVAQPPPKQIPPTNNN